MRWNEAAIEIAKEAWEEYGNSASNSVITWGGIRPPLSSHSRLLIFTASPGRHEADGGGPGPEGP